MAFFGLAGIAGSLIKKAAGFPKRQARKELKRQIARDTVGVGVKAGQFTGGIGFTYPSSGGGQRPKSGSSCGPMKKSRHMNVGNARALNRALRRMEGFEKLAKRYLKIQHAGTPHGFKRRSRAKR